MNFQNTATAPAIATTTTDYSSIGQINIAPVPQSDWIMISANDKVHLVRYSVQAVPATPVLIPFAAAMIPGTPVNPTPVLTALTSISSLLISFMTSDALLAMGSNVVALRFTDDTANDEMCHENCRPTGAVRTGCDTTVTAPNIPATGHYFSTSCRVGFCTPGAIQN